MAPISISTPYLFVLLILALFVFIIILFLPALIELKRPKDPGPRKITETTETVAEEDD